MNFELSNSQANIIECEEITVVRDNKEILCAASCCVPRNSLTFLVGENGTGKTTLVQTMLGILPQREGKISAFLSRPDLIKHVHWSDNYLYDVRGRKDSHLSVGKGTIPTDFHRLVKELDATILLEHF